MTESQAQYSTKSGIFIAFEGADGVGKTTQVQLLKERLQAGQLVVTTTREPGGSVTGEMIRDIILNGSMGFETELLLFAAQRAEHLSATIKPALQEGNVVISDRHYLSNLAYQGQGDEGRRTQIKRVADATYYADGASTPDITIVIKSNEEQRSLQVAQRGDLDQFEANGITQANVVEYFNKPEQELQDDNRGGLVLVVDGTGSKDEVHQRIAQKLDPYLIALLSDGRKIAVVKTEVTKIDPSELIHPRTQPSLVLWIHRNEEHKAQVIKHISETVENNRFTDVLTLLAQVTGKKVGGMSDEQAWQAIGQSICESAAGQAFHVSLGLNAYEPAGFAARYFPMSWLPFIEKINYVGNDGQIEEVSSVVHDSVSQSYLAEFVKQLTPKGARAHLIVKGGPDLPSELEIEQAILLNPEIDLLSHECFFASDRFSPSPIEQRTSSYDHAVFIATQSDVVDTPPGLFATVQHLEPSNSN